LLFPNCGRVAAEREEWRSGGGFWRSGQSDGVRAAGRGVGSVSRYDLVGNYFYVYVDFAVDFCGAEDWSHVGFLWSKDDADEIAARDTDSSGAADGSAEPGAYAEIAVVSLELLGELRIPRFARDDNG